MNRQITNKQVFWRLVGIFGGTFGAAVLIVVLMLGASSIQDQKLQRMQNYNNTRKLQEQNQNSNVTTYSSSSSSYEVEK